MTVESHSRGHKIIYRPLIGWVWADTLQALDDDRPCKRCGRAPTPDGYDACLGHIDGATGACCGHGISTIEIKTEKGE